MFDFEANYADELSAKCGDIIQVIYCFLSAHASIDFFLNQRPILSDFRSCTASTKTGFTLNRR